MMDIILQTNIFFYITSAAVVLVTILIILVLFYVLSILRNVRDISDKAKEGTEILAEDLGELRKNVKKEGFKARQIIDYFLQLITPKRKRKTKTKN